MIPEIEAVEERLKEAMINSDLPVLDQLLADDLYFVNHLGQVMSKEQDLEAHKTGFAQVDAITLSDMHIKPMKNAAVVSVIAEIQGTFGGEAAEASFRFMRVWQKDKHTSWQIKSAQSTLLA